MAKWSPRVPTLCAVVAWVAASLPAGASSQTGTPTRLLEAVKSRDTTAVRTLLAITAPEIEINATQGDGATPLHWAAYGGELEIVELLIGRGARVDVADDHGITPLWLAAANNAPDVVERLLNTGAKANVAHSSGETALMAASRTGHHAAVRHLLAAGARVDGRERARGQTALMWASAQGHTAIVQTLVAAGAALHERSTARRQWVNATGNADYTGVMEVEQGGYTPLLFAVRGNHLDTVRALLALGAKVHDVSADGTSAVVLAAHSGHREMTRLLLDAGADPNADGSGYTALHIAVRRGDVDVVKALVARGANPNARVVRATPARRISDDVALPRDVVGSTPLWLAARYGQVEVLEALGDTADPALTANDGSTALMMAIGRDARGSLEAVRHLIDRGADVHASDELGDTALHKAASAGFDEVVRLLVDKGASVDVRNQQGQSPLAMTRRRGGRDGVVDHQTTAALLRQLGARE